MELTTDHHTLNDAETTRRYFAKFERIIGHLAQVAVTSQTEGLISKLESEIMRGYLQALLATFTGLSNKYLMTGRMTALLPNALTIDRRDSGFPIYQEILQMANDALQAEKHLQHLPDTQQIKKDMVREILNEHTIPTDLQYALSQRLYYEHLNKGDAFWAQADPEAVWLENINGRGFYLLHWANYDSQLNIPIIYMMLVEDTGRTALLRDEKRWPRVQAHLMAQSMASLKLLTIAQGFDRDFDDLHPKLLRRFRIGPMYSHSFTRQTGPLREVLAEAAGDAGDDWALAWTAETLESKRVEKERAGFFGSVEREIYTLDHFAKSDVETGATTMHRALIIPQRPHQVLEERAPKGLRGVRKYVVGPKGRLLSYR
ncbi:MAG: hypothetical protein V3V13_10665 [Paracoccaceae bacterium]